VSKPINNVVIEKERVSQVPIDVTVNINQGDMMKFIETTRTVIPMAAGDAGSQAASEQFVGVSNDTNPITSIKQPIPDARIAIITRGIVRFTADDNGLYFPGDAVTIGADPQKVRLTSQSGNNIIGFVAPENSFTLSGSPASVVGIQAVQGVTQLLINLRPQFTQLTSI
jgi:hypothetical protein